jgi:hypothetical protein
MTPFFVPTVQNTTKAFLQYLQQNPTIRLFICGICKYGAFRGVLVAIIATDRLTSCDYCNIFIENS